MEVEMSSCMYHEMHEDFVGAAEVGKAAAIL
jgi:hypothetical protein